MLPLLRDLGEDLVSANLFPYHLHQPEATPLTEDLLLAARAWVSQAGVDRAAFYSAQEEAAQADVTPAGKGRAGKKAAPRKKVTTADLAQQMGVLTSLLPQLTEQLTAMKERQEVLEKRVSAGAAGSVASPPKPLHQQSFLPARWSAVGKASGLGWPAPSDPCSCEPVSKMRSIQGMTPDGFTATLPSFLHGIQGTSPRSNVLVVVGTSQCRWSFSTFQHWIL